MNQAQMALKSAAIARSQQPAKLPKNFAEILATRTLTEASTLMGLSDPTVRKWALRNGLEWCYRCAFCEQAVPRSQCVGQKRCRSCHEKILAGTLTTPKRCSKCKQVKPYNEFYLNSANLAAMSECKDCCVNRFSMIKEREDAIPMAHWVHAKLSPIEGRLHYWVQGGVVESAA